MAHPNENFIVNLSSRQVVALGSGGQLNRADLFANWFVDRPENFGSAAYQGVFGVDEVNERTNGYTGCMVRVATDFPTRVTKAERGVKKEDSLETVRELRTSRLPNQLLQARGDRQQKAQTQGFEVKRILVDSGSVVDVLSWGAYQKMGLKEQALSKASTFWKQSSQGEGLYHFANHLGGWQIYDYEVRSAFFVDHPMAYNVIFGGPIKRMTKMVAATACLKIKFPIRKGVGF
ncbi:hypothetical protein PVK06_029670 [Gossypium arboreum]|uniref:Uncharacterized protein n=1 Tax=Gossypium arboreum TaxID=29729 RepID=A0ABR0NPA4_GOSAR|nr:hypothetical protein PVK06_029670 [Gossypium arboreum]